MRSTSEITGLGGALANEALVEPSRMEPCVFSWNADSGARCLLSDTKVYEPYIRARLRCTPAAHPLPVVVDVPGRVRVCANDAFDSADAQRLERCSRGGEHRVQPQVENMLSRGEGSSPA